MEFEYIKILTLGTYWVIVNFNILANGNLDIWFKIQVYRKTGDAARQSKKGDHTKRM